MVRDHSCLQRGPPPATLPRLRGRVLRWPRSAVRGDRRRRRQHGRDGRGRRTPRAAPPRSSRHPQRSERRQGRCRAEGNARSARRLAVGRRRRWSYADHGGQAPRGSPGSRRRRGDRLPGSLGRLRFAPDSSSPRDGRTALQLGRRAYRPLRDSRQPVRIQSVHCRRGEHALSADDHRGLRLRRRAASPGAPYRLQGRRARRELGRSAGQQIQRPARRPADDVADSPCPESPGQDGMTSARSALIEPFLAVEMSERAVDLERQGVDVVHLEVGEPDFAAPPVVRDAAEKALKDGRTKYTHSLSLLRLREAISEHYRVTYGVEVSPDRILVTPGTSPAMLLLFGHLLDAGDEVVLSNPYYACYPNFIRYAEGVPVEVDVTETDRFQYRPEAIRERLSPRSKAIVVNSPANPTASVLAPARMAASAHLANERGVAVVSDEIYHGLTEGGRDHTILEFADQAFVLNGFSKAFAMTGWRLGWVIVPREHVRALQTVYGNFFISTNEFVQWAGVAALREAIDEPARFRRI